MRFSKQDLLLQENGIEFGSFSNGFSKTFNYSLPANYAQSRYPIYAHVYLTKEGFHPDPSQGGYDPISTVYRRLNLIDKMPRPRATSNLVQSKTDDGTCVKSSSPLKEMLTDEKNENMVLYWYPRINIGLLQDESPIDLSTLTSGMARTMSVTLDRTKYLPTLYMYEGWRLRDHRIILNRESSDLPLTIHFSSIGALKLKLLTHFDHSFQVNESLLGNDSEMEKLKQMFIETNPYLLIATLLVSIIHSVFDFLAFKNDVQFWRSRENFQGLSVRSILINGLFQLVILLYLLEEDASWLILISVGVGLLIELWKITKALQISVKRRGLFPLVTINSRSDYSSSLTNEYDSRAVKLLGTAALPLLIGYAAYSLAYEKHRGWYSWILGTLVGFVYTFGFITMTPQLFINYKLKSVAHMPWRVFIYKALNTFIDDMFAFIIKMPTLHRLACFRDDIVFLIYLYQRWVYPVDKSRPNEYGQVLKNDKKKDPSSDGEQPDDCPDSDPSQRSTLTSSSLVTARSRRASTRLRQTQKP